MLKNKTIKGDWFLPSNPEEKIQGTLHFSPETEITLDLFGAFFKEKNILKGKDKSSYIPVIYGLDSDGKCVALIYCYRRSYSNHLRTNHHFSTYLVKSIVHGNKLISIDENIFSSISLSINLLNQWIGKNVLEETIFYKSLDQIDGFQFKYKESEVQEKYKFKLDDNLTLEIIPSAWFNNEKPNEIRLFETYKVRFTSLKKLTFEEFRKLAVRFHSFIELAYDDPIFFTYISIGIFKEGTIEPEKLEWNNVLFSQPNINPDFKRPLRVRFDYNLIKDNLETIFKNWFSFDPILEPLIEQLIVSKLKTNNIKADFLNVTQSLDGFHRRFLSDKGMKYEIRLKALCEYCSQIKNIKFNVPELLTIAENRHYYTHLFKEMETSYHYTLEELYQETQKLRALFFCCVMKEIGFSNEMLEWVWSDLY